MNEWMNEWLFNDTQAQSLHLQLGVTQKVFMPKYKNNNKPQCKELHKMFVTVINIYF